MILNNTFYKIEIESSLFYFGDRNATVLSIVATKTTF